MGKTGVGVLDPVLPDFCCYNRYQDGKGLNAGQNDIENVPTVVLGVSRPLVPYPTKTARILSKFL